MLASVKLNRFGKVLSDTKSETHELPRYSCRRGDYGPDNAYLQAGWIRAEYCVFEFRRDHEHLVGSRILGEPNPSLYDEE